jgi:hypothetical protein
MLRPLWPGLAGWWETFTALLALDGLLWYTAGPDPAWRAGFAWAFLPLVFLAVYSCSLALARYIDRRVMGTPSARHPARRNPARNLEWYEIRDLDRENTRELERRYGPRR